MAYLLKKLVKAVITLWIIFTVTFFATRMSGDAINYVLTEGGNFEARRAMLGYLGLDKPWFEQYFITLKNLLHADSGTSFYFRLPVAQLYASRFPATLTLCGLALLVSAALGIPLGIVSGVKRNTLSSLIQTSAFLIYSVPNFVLGIMLILLFSYWLQWLPSSGSETWRHYIMPITALSSDIVAAFARFSRSAMLDVLSQDYIRTAHAKGLGGLGIISIHALRNALVTIITVVGLHAAVLVSGAVVVESIFSWPGIGELLVYAALKRDYPLLQTGVLLVGAVVITINFVVDMIYVMIDPRIRLEN